MMNALALILSVFAFVCFVLASTPLGVAYWQRLVSAGLAFWIAVHIFTSGSAFLK